MRLLKIQTNEDVVLTEFFGNDIPPYAILSHTWGPATEEVSFRDLIDNTGKNKVGYGKIEFCGQRALADGLQYFWVDTCCIDKSSSAELTEAINSMFRYYQDAVKCYVYLSDVPYLDYGKAFRQSRWFTRGWTLQELIAPKSVEFYSQDEIRLGDKVSLEAEIHEITGIAILALRGHHLSSFSIEDRMSWASKRMTTREEDATYCLLGIFDIYMPLIYGEGKNAARRLREEIKKYSNATPEIPDDFLTVSQIIRNPIIRNPVPKHSEIVQWLKPHDPHTNHLAAQRKKQLDTGTWFIQGKQYNNWLRGDVPLLWISGSPGFGKTILCSTIVEDLLEKCKNLPVDAMMMAYYYFDFSETGMRTLDAFLRSVIVQLTATISQFPYSLLDYYTFDGFRKQDLSTESLKEILQDSLRQSLEAIIVVDALDECSQPEELVQLIEEIRSWRITKLKIIVVSREQFEGADILADLQPVHVPMRGDIANNDISMFVEGILGRDVKLRKWPLHVKEQIKSTLISKARGMFRWVGCQVDVLKKCRTQAQVDQVLKSLPLNLEETYDRILDEISDSYKSEVRAVLQWLAFAQRPMRQEEIAEIVAFDEAHTKFCIKKRLLNPLDILTICSSLLVSQRASYEHSEYGEVVITELRLAHFSVKDYLLSPNRKNSRHAYYSLEEKASNAQVAKACLTYLSMKPLSNGYRGRDMQDIILTEWPLLDYAARYCGAHLQIVEKELELTTRDLLHNFLGTHILPNGGNFGTLVGTMWYTATLDLIERTAPLYFAASYGLVSIVQLLLTSGSDIDLEAEGGHHASTALQVAAYRGHTGCVRLLLDAGADPNSRNSLDQSSLYWAQVQGFAEIVELLLSHGATPEEEIYELEYRDHGPFTRMHRART